MVKRSLVLFVFMLTACDRLPGYQVPVTVNEGGAVWDARLIKSFHNDRMVAVEVEYTNRTGAAFSIKPQNIVVTTEDGERWIADGRGMLLPLLQPGESRTVRAGFSNVAVTKKALLLRPFAGLAHADPAILLKAKGDEPLPGDHTDPAWDKAR